MLRLEGRNTRSYGKWSNCWADQTHEFGYTTGKTTAKVGDPQIAREITGNSCWPVYFGVIERVSHAILGRDSIENLDGIARGLRNINQVLAIDEQRYWIAADIIASIRRQRSLV